MITIWVGGVGAFGILGPVGENLTGLNVPSTTMYLDMIKKVSEKATGTPRATDHEITGV